MYGIVNKSMEELVTGRFGQSTWATILERSGCDIDFFLSNESYDDAVTYKLAGAAADVLGISIGEVLHTFGEYWILTTCREKYGGLLETGGTTLQEFLLHLPLFHTRVMMVYPGITPPIFKTQHFTDTSIDIEYHSQRQGLQEFMRGILSGLGILYQQPIDITLLQSRDAGDSFEIFRVSW